jgi:hypothetical protein
VSSVESDLFLVRGSLGFDRLGAETAVTIPVDGILVVTDGEGSSITLASGTLRGIRYLDAKGNPLVLTSNETRMKVFRVAVGAAVTLVHNDTINVAEPAERLIISSGQNIPLKVSNTQFFWGYSSAFTSFRWGVQDIEAYTPASASDWNPTPARFSPALDQLASRTPSEVTDSYTSTSGVPEIVWSYTLAEDEVVGGVLWVTAKHTDGGVTYRSRGFVDFGASRSVGGTAATTVNTNPENGTIAAGSLTVDTDGANTVRVNVTYSVNGTVDYTYRLALDTL